MLKKIVDGVEIELSKEEESHVRQFWDFNINYPEYRDCNRYDRLNAPFICIETAKVIHKINIKKIVDEKLLDLSKKIEDSEESFDETSKIEFFKKRKILKDMLCHDCSSYNTIEELKNHLEHVKSL